MRVVQIYTSSDFSKLVLCYGPAQAEAGVEVEEVEKDLDTLDEQAQRAAVAADAPELGALLAELRANLAEVRTRVGPLVKEV